MSYRWMKPAGLGLAALLFTACANPSPGNNERTIQNSERTVISTPDAPEAIGPYSQGILSGNTLYAAGQIGIDPSTGQLADESLESEAVQTMNNLKAVLEAAGMGFEDVVQVQVFLTDITQFGAFNEIYSGYFGSEPPARAVVEVSALPLQARVEVILTAVK